MSSSDKVKLDGIASGAEVNVQSDWSVTDSSSDAYIKNKPSIPTVNNGTLTIQKNGSNVATFTANQSGNSTANITVPVNLADLSGRTIDKISEPSYSNNTPTLTTMSRVDRLRANRFAGGLHPTSIICETSTDEGSTWQSAGLSDNDKLKLLSNAGSGINIPLKNGVKSCSCMARVTISGIEFNDTVKALSETARFAQMTPENWYNNRVYATISDLYFWLSSNADKIAINVYASRGNAKDTWVSAGSHPGASGWSGMDTIHLNDNYSFGGASSQTGNFWFIRIIFRTCANDGSFDDSKLNQSYLSSQQGIYNIMGYGANSWGAPNPMGSIDRPYTYHGNNGTYLHEVYRWNGDLNPSSNNTYNLGSTDRNWNDFYIGGTIYLPNNNQVRNVGSALTLRYNGSTKVSVEADKVGVYDKLVPLANGLLDLGSSNLKWKDLYLNGTLNYPYGKILSTSTPSILYQNSAGTNKYALDLSTGGFRPLDSFDLGSSTNQWKDLYLSGKIDLGNSISLQSTLFGALGINIGGYTVFTVYQNSSYTNSLKPTNSNYDLGDSSSRWKDLYLSGNLIGSSKSVSIDDIALSSEFETETSKNQSTSVIVGNAITNINGRVFQNYTANLVTAGGYTFYQILKNGSNPTEDEAKEYMRYMTGSTFLPTYNYDFPKQTIFTFADRSTWKPQYSSSDGLRLYRLTTSLALESQINPGTVTSVRVQAGTGLSSSQSTAQTSTLNTTISIASGYKLPTTTQWNTCIKNVSLSGTTLTFTRNDNTTITITLPSGGQASGGDPNIY